MLDEQFKFVQNGSSVKQIDDAQEFKAFTESNLSITKRVTGSQYDYIYSQYSHGNLNNGSPVKSNWTIVNAGGIPIIIKNKYVEK